MPYQIIETTGRGRERRTSPAIRFSGSQAIFILPAAFLDQAGLKVGDRCDIYRGTGADAGSLMIVRGNSYLLTFNGGKSTHCGKIVVACNRVGVVKAQVKTTDIEGFVADGKIFLILPDRLRSDCRANAPTPSAPAHPLDVAAE